MNLPKPWNLKNMSSLAPPLPARPKKLSYRFSSRPRSPRPTPPSAPGCWCCPDPRSQSSSDHQDEKTWSENELEGGSDDGDTYEPPPTERPLRTVATIEPICDNDYIERPGLVKPPASLPKPGPKPPADLPKVQNIKSDSEPASNIAQGTLMNNVFQDTPPILPPPGHRQSQLPIPVEDVDGADYLEFDPIDSRGSTSLPDPRPQLSIPPRGVNLPTPVAKPPVPIGKPLPYKPPISSEEMPIPSSVGKRISASQTKLGVLVPTPFIQRGSFPRKQEGPLGNTSSGLISSSSIVGENTNFASKPWYASKYDRKTAEAALRENGKDGAFLVRPSSACDRNQPYTLAVLCKSKVYNIPVRFIEAINQYVLGKEKAGELRFNSVPGMIDYHQQNSLILIDQQNNNKDSTLLLYPVRN